MLLTMFLLDNSFIVKGFLVGFSVAAPIGPVAIFCIRQTLTFGRLAGLAAGLGVSLADGVYSGVAVYCASFIERFIHQYAKWFFLGGGLFLLFLGFSILRSKVQPQKNTENVPARNLWMSFSKTLLLTFASPMTTLLFIGMFTAYGVFETPVGTGALSRLVLGVFLGALAWWTFLSFTIKYIQQKLSQNFFKYINLVSGILIMVYGGLTLVKFIASIL